MLLGKWGGYRKKHNGMFWNIEKLLELAVGVGYMVFTYVRPSLRGVFPELFAACGISVIKQASSNKSLPGY